MIHPVPRPAKKKRRPRAHNSTLPVGQRPSPKATRSARSAVVKKNKVLGRSLRSRTGVKPVNAKRRKSEFARCYHSKARVEWVKSLPCAVCGVVGFSENAHVGGVEGMGRKGSYATIAPLCGPYDIVPGIQTYHGCHRTRDENRAFREEHAVRLAHAALDVEAEWRVRSGASQ